MGGLAPIPYYRYDTNGKFLEKFKSGRDVSLKYYKAKSGRLFEKNHTIRELPDGSLLSKERIGRNAIRKAYAIMKSPYCQMTKSKHKDKSFSIFNLKGELLGTFPNMITCCLLTGFKQGRVYNALKEKSSIKSELIFKYETK